MKLLDTNILVYAHGLPHPLQIPCQRILRANLAYPDLYSIDAETLQEIAYLYIRRGERTRALKTITETLRIFNHVFAVTRDDIATMRDLRQQYPSLLSRDAVHAAVVLTNGLDGLVTADTDFEMIPAIARFDPAAEAALWPE